MRWPAAFNGTDLDPDANRKRMEALVKKIEDLAASLNGRRRRPKPNLSPATRLAAMLKEALAANTIGGKAGDDSRWRAAAEEVARRRPPGRASARSPTRSVVSWLIGSSERRGGSPSAPKRRSRAAGRGGPEPAPGGGSKRQARDAGAGVPA